MWPLKRKGGSAVAERPPAHSDPLFAEIERLTAKNREQRSGDAERELLRLRHEAGIQLLSSAARNPKYASPDKRGLPKMNGGLPEIDAGEVTPELIRAGILRDGCLLVRGLVDRDRALEFAGEIDRSFDERDKHEREEPREDGYYDEFEPNEGFNPLSSRGWIQAGGGVLAVDSPKLIFEMVEMFGEAGVPQLVAGYLGEPGIITGEKTTLRKAEPQIAGAWHQDGAFMGGVRALNLWLSLSRCGDEAPGLDLLPRRLNELVATQTEEAVLSYQISQSKAEEAAGDTPLIRPIFEPGDALFFDELFMHQTGSDPSMPKPRYAIESWFFGPSASPPYIPIAV